ncbi:hypothetical protein H6A66_10980 [Bacteroides caecigallinarum]|uniref:hypothetical protein n=1 Tax=Bacteroides caecigallinarum TaxID=1411144 RepID=UPI001957355D|nr:hypothetical protein [Bacteroides caecigallinarum]MBM6865686.1 hypothetical protein [Bacteroides caecigallinarum]
MKGIQIKINGQWLYLPEDFSIDLEQCNPLFNEQGTFSFPFEIPLEPNRHIFKNIADPFSDLRIEDIDKQEMEVWFDGIMLYRGIIEIDEEIEIEDTIPVTFLSGNSDFMSRIEEMNAQDVPLDRDINLGYALTEYHISYTVDDSTLFAYINLPSKKFMVYNANVSDPYPIKPYCNVRICANTDKGKATIMSAYRPYSGVCFYVRYFLDCLFSYLQVVKKQDDLGNYEDMNRLAFFGTKCDYTLSESSRIVSYNDEIENLMYGGEGSEPFSYNETDHYIASRKFQIYLQIRVKPKDKSWYDVSFGLKNGSYRVKDVFATQKNFPNAGVKDIIDSLQTAFGIRFIYDDKQSSVSIIYISDLLKSNDYNVLDDKILSYKVVQSKREKMVLTYGVSDNTAFNYGDYNNSKEYSDYNAILNAGIYANDLTRKIDVKTGNHYKVKVNKETGGDPTLFEVDGFRDYSIGEGEENEQTIAFAPVIVNDVSKGMWWKYVEGNQQAFAVYVDEEFTAEETKQNAVLVFEHFLPPSWFQKVKECYVSFKGEDNYDINETEESPLQTYDPGLVLGIMRGAGNKSGVEYEANYDGEGNSSWSQTVANYSFTSDSCDNYGRFFDYNGTEAGGADQTGRFSLKLVAGKDGYPIDSQYADRGLVSKFLSEYLYFMANKKTVVLTVRMNITQIIGIDFLKRYKIGDFVGFINKVSYTLDVNGVTDATIELYTL